MTSIIRIIIVTVIIFAITKVGDITGNEETVQWLKVVFVTFLLYAVYKVDKIDDGKFTKEKDENL